MSKKNKSTLIRLVAMALVLVLALPMSANAAVADPIQPMVSDYLISYSGKINALGGGKIRVFFSVTAKRDMANIGALNIHIYESTDNSNWTWIKAFNYNSTSGMMTTNDWYHEGTVTHQVTAGRYYRAYISIYVGQGNDGDSRFFYTASKLAT